MFDTSISQGTQTTHLHGLLVTIRIAFNVVYKHTNETRFTNTVGQTYKYIECDVILPPQTTLQKGKCWQRPKLCTATAHRNVI